MHEVVTYARRLLSGDDGLTNSECAILLALLVIAAVVGIRLIGADIRTVYRFVTAVPL